MNKRGVEIKDFSYFDSNLRREIYLRALERDYKQGKINRKKYLEYKNQLLSEIEGVKGFFERFEFGLQKITMLFL